MLKFSLGLDFLETLAYVCTISCLKDLRKEEAATIASCP